MVAPMNVKCEYIVGDWVKCESDTSSPPKLAFEVLAINGELVVLRVGRDGDEFEGYVNSYRPFWS